MNVVAVAGVPGFANVVLRNVAGEAVGSVDQSTRPYLVLGGEGTDLFVSVLCFDGDHFRSLSFLYLHYIIRFSRKPTSLVKKNSELHHVNYHGDKPRGFLAIYS